MNTQPLNPQPERVPDYHKAGYPDPVLLLFGKEIPVAHSPFISVLNAPIRDGMGNQTCIHAELWGFYRRQQKLPQSLRELLTKMTDANKAQIAPVKLPFITDKKGSLAVEVFWGKRRYIAYVDPGVPEYYRFHEIPVGSDDPEAYMKTVSPS